MTTRKAKEARYAHINESAFYMRKAGDALAALKDEFQALSPPVIATNHLGPFSGEPTDFAIWLIFETRVDRKRALETGVTETAAVKARTSLSTYGFPPEAIETLTFNSTSKDEIEDAGGSFAFFR